MGLFIGGQIVNMIGISNIGFVGAIIGLIGGLYCIVSTKQKL